MNLISCNNCGVVLDQNKLNFPTDIRDEDGCIDPGEGAWDPDYGEHRPYIECPVCESQVFKGWS